MQCTVKARSLIRWSIVLVGVVVVVVGAEERVVVGIVVVTTIIMVVSIGLVVRIIVVMREVVVVNIAVFVGVVVGIVVVLRIRIIHNLTVKVPPDVPEAIHVAVLVALVVAVFPACDVILIARGVWEAILGVVVVAIIVAVFVAVVEAGEIDIFCMTVSFLPIVCMLVVLLVGIVAFRLVVARRVAASLETMVIASFVMTGIEFACVIVIVDAIVKAVVVAVVPTTPVGIVLFVVILLFLFLFLGFVIQRWRWRRGRWSRWRSLILRSVQESLVWSEDIKIFVRYCVSIDTRVACVVIVFGIPRGSRRVS